MNIRTSERQGTNEWNTVRVFPNVLIMKVYTNSKNHYKQDSDISETQRN